MDRGSAAVVGNFGFERLHRHGAHDVTLEKPGRRLRSPDAFHSGIRVMRVGFFKCTFIWTLLLCSLSTGTAFGGFFGFGDDDRGKSGLDFNRGYDVNTVVTVSGRVTSLPHEGEQGQVFLGVGSGSESINVSLGPSSYWAKKGIAIRLSDEIAARGSKAQGQDGRSYHLPQNLVNRTTGARTELRSGRGNPAWIRVGTAGTEENGLAGGLMGGAG